MEKKKNSRSHAGRMWARDDLAKTFVSVSYSQDDVNTKLKVFAAAGYRLEGSVQRAGIEFIMTMVLDDEKIQTSLPAKQRPLPETIEETVAIITGLAERWGIVLTLDHPCAGMNSAGSCFDCIDMGTYDDPSIMLFAFFHELGHVESAKRSKESGKTHTMSTLTEEGYAWELALELAGAEGFHFDFYGKEMAYGRRSFRSYINKEWMGELERNSEPRPDQSERSRK